MGQYCPLSCGDPLYKTHVVDSYRSGEKGSGTDIGSAGNSPKQEKSLRQELSSAVKAAHPSEDGLHVPRLQIHRSPPYQKIAGTSVQVSSHCYQCTLLHW